MLSLEDVKTDLALILWDMIFTEVFTLCDSVYYART